MQQRRFSLANVVEGMKAAYIVNLAAAAKNEVAGLARVRPAAWSVSSQSYMAAYANEALAYIYCYEVYSFVPADPTTYSPTQGRSKFSPYSD